MDGVLTGVVAVLATLAGAFASYYFQRRAAVRAEDFTRSEWLREQQLAAYSSFAGSVLLYRQAQHERTLRVFDGAADETGDPVRKESYVQKAACWDAFYRIKLLSGDAEITRLAEEAVRLTGCIHDAGDREELRELGRGSRAAVDRFVTEAGARVVPGAAQHSAAAR